MRVYLFPYSAWPRGWWGEQVDRHERGGIGVGRPEDHTELLANLQDESFHCCRVWYWSARSFRVRCCISVVSV